MYRASPNRFVNPLLLALLLIICLCVAVGGVRTKADNALPRAALRPASTTGVNGMIAYTRVLDSNSSEIYVTNPDGSNQTNLTNDPLIDRTPAWSPRGDLLVFSSARGQPRYFPGNIYVADSNGSITPRTYFPDGTDFKIIAPTWSPDGSQILYIDVCFVCASGPGPHSRFRLIKADGTPLEQILSIPDEVTHSPSWSPDGTRIAFAISHRDFRTIPSRITSSIYVVNADGGGLSKIASVSGPDNTHSDTLVGGSPAWSPDGTRLTFTGHQSGDAEVYVVNAGGGNAQSLTRHPANDGDAVWSPDGSHIAFVSDRSGNQDIYVMNADGGNQTQVTNSLDDEVAPSWQNLAAPGEVPLEAATIQFDDFNYDTNEVNGVGVVTVTRLGDTTTWARVDYASADGTATANSDYRPTSGTLQFAPGESAHTIPVVLLDDAQAEGVETVNIVLTNANGANLGGASSAGLVIGDNEVPAALSPIDDAEFFARQHYADFLDRDPDAAGLAYWKSRIVQCGLDARCIHERRIGVSAAFFIELEFQVTGSFVYRLFRASYGRLPTYAEFGADRGRIVAGGDLEANKQALLREWVQRAAFRAAYPDGPPDPFVNKLFDTAGLVPYTAERQQLIAEMYQGKTRERALSDVIEIAAFKQREFNPSFVLMQYFGYLRREPDTGGFQFWLNVLNNRLPNDATGYRSMVCAFLTSYEYQNRFGRVTRTNAECGQ